MVMHMQKFTDEYFRQRLTPEQYSVLREKRTEPPFTGKYLKHRKRGEYTCAACGQVLFTSDTKYDSGSGWPSFYDLVDEGSVILQDDFSHGMARIEVLCSNCGSHLGHLFDDETNPTGKYYCINSCALDFKKKA